MRNDTKSKISLSMRHIDNDNLMRKFLNALRCKAYEGGDLNVTIECESGKPRTFFLGHDVIFQLDYKIED